MNNCSDSSAGNANAARTPAFVMDGAGIVVQWNSEAEAMFGWLRNEAVGRRLSELIIPERNRAVHEAGLKHFMSAKGRGALLNRKLDLVMLHRDGREFSLGITIGSEETADIRRFPTYIERH
ncbi:MAG TPA: PAS domain-containing protein [Candidatus Binataceae bacterium]|nr:PAS domain-containing protein [Candidatus Binataceae bacterium]